jgi:predicted RNA-binding Zn ribbon-like protein
MRRAAQALRSAHWVDGRFGYQPTWPPDTIEMICDRLADEAVVLLRSPAAGRIGSCAGCGWLFLDTSRAHARRWCSMNVCGVRDKMRRYHQRQTSAMGAS